VSACVGVICQDLKQWKDLCAVLAVLRARMCQLILASGSTAVQISSPQYLQSQTTVECHKCKLLYVNGGGGTAYSLLCRSCAVVQARGCCHVGLFLSMSTKQPLAAFVICKASLIPPTSITTYQVVPQGSSSKDSSHLCSILHWFLEL
jgi:hypothetical protein